MPPHHPALLVPFGIISTLLSHSVPLPLLPPSKVQKVLANGGDLKSVPYVPTGPHPTFHCCLTCHLINSALSLSASCFHPQRSRRCWRMAADLKSVPTSLQAPTPSPTTASSSAIVLTPLPLSLCLSLPSVRSRRCWRMGETSRACPTCPLDPTPPSSSAHTAPATSAPRQLPATSPPAPPPAQSPSFSRQGPGGRARARPTASSCPRGGARQRGGGGDHGGPPAMRGTARAVLSVVSWA